ncbi:MAG: hypothetical protein IJV08_03825 [Bacteroidaceae bacterium]|nr:hypothetical protein [Bacteroidaceae bacterium]
MEKDGCNAPFIARHREDDVRRLALSRAPEGVDLKWCLQQIEGWQLARRKLPRWAATEGLWFPVRLSMEQCSSEPTARYKRTVIGRMLPEEERTCMTDLTGGLGVDFSYMAPLFREAQYFEVQPQLLELARHNMPLLVPPATQLAFHLVPPESRPSLSSQTLIFLDPARRDAAGRKTVDISDCTPNLLDLQDTLLAQTQWLMVKLSPMLDLRQALRQLRGVREVHVVSVGGECKELLFVMSAKEGANDPHPTIHCVNLDTDDDDLIVSNPHLPSPAPNLLPLTSYPLPPTSYLYEPNASVLKAGVQDVLCERYPVTKLHPQSHLFMGDSFLPHFPGRRFRITGWSDFSKRNLKALIGDLRQANLTVRNFPTPVATLRRQLRLAEGGDVYLFATTQQDGRHILIRCERT